MLGLIFLSGGVLEEGDGIILKGQHTRWHGIYHDHVSYTLLFTSNNFSTSIWIYVHRITSNFKIVILTSFSLV